MLESLRGQVQDLRSSSSSSSRFVNRHGDHSRSSCIPQLRQAMADVTQQLRTEMNETIIDRIDVLSSITSALQNVSLNPIGSKPYRISDFIPTNWEGSNDKA